MALRPIGFLGAVAQLEKNPDSENGAGGRGGLRFGQTLSDLQLFRRRIKGSNDEGGGTHLRRVWLAVDVVAPVGSDERCSAVTPAPAPRLDGGLEKAPAHSGPLRPDWRRFGMVDAELDLAALSTSPAAIFLQGEVPSVDATVLLHRSLHQHLSAAQMMKREAAEVGSMRRGVSSRGVKALNWGYRAKDGPVAPIQGSPIFVKRGSLVWPIDDEDPGLSQETLVAEETGMADKPDLFPNYRAEPISDLAIH